MAFVKQLKEFLFFSEPKKMEKFTLDEGPGEKSYRGGPEKLKETKDTLTKNNEKKEISKKLSENLEYIKSRFSIPDNGDVILREFDIIVKDKSIPAFLFFYDGMVDRKVIDDDIMAPLMLLSNLDIKSDEKDIAEYIRKHLLPHNQIKETKEYRQVIDEVNFGGCGIFIEGIDTAFAADVKGWEHRTVGRPNTEILIRGPQEGFTEILRVNTALIRKRMKDEDVIAESVEIGERSKTPCSMMYVKDIANESLVAEVRRRLKSIKIDYLNDSGELEQFIEDNPFMPSPQMVATERPDRVASMLAEGKVAVIVHGSPFALVLPTTYHELTHSPEDSYMRFPYANLMRIIRIFAMLLSLLLPGIYIAITNFHQEMIPTDLLIAIEASREKVPFPSLVEILVMEISFELIREAGIRIPGPIGPTLGIIGGLILGQAAVAANIVSPILIIVVAVTGIGSFAFPNYSMSFAYRLLRFFYIFLGVSAGFLGISTGIFLHGMWVVSAKSFGVPFMAPFAPKTYGGISDALLKGPIWVQEKRPDYLNTKDKEKQPEISREWTKPKKGDDDNGRK